MYDVSLQITPIGYTSDGEARYLVVNSSEAPDAPELALVVNEVAKNLLVYFNQLWNNHSSAILKCVKNHYQTIIYMVHAFSEEASGSEIPSEFAQTPLVGVPTHTEEEIDGVNLSTVKYVSSGEAARLLSATIDASYIDAFVAIATDYTKYPTLWYYVLNKYKALFTNHILQKEET